MEKINSKINTTNNQIIIPLHKVNPYKETNPLEKLIKNLEQTNTYKDFWGSIDSYMQKDKAAKYVNENLIKKGDYYVQTGFAQEIELLNSKLIYLNRNNISICPKVVKMITNDSGCSALVYKIPNSKKLIPYENNEDCVSQSYKEKTFKELLQILDMGMVNIDILENPENIKISLPEKQIVCEDWTSLCSMKTYIENYAPESGRLDIMKNLQKTIFNK